MSRRKLDYIIFIDLEATCWASFGDRGSQVSEIIEIGACFLNVETLKPEQKRSYIIRPTYSTISDFCTNLTSITPEMIQKEGMPFADAINKFKKDFEPALRTWASWGSYDKAKLEFDCTLKNVNFPMGKNYINAKNLYSLKFGFHRELGLKRALNREKIEFEGTHHRGSDDAWNSAKLLAKILQR